MLTQTDFMLKKTTAFYDTLTDILKVDGIISTGFDASYTVGEILHLKPRESSPQWYTLSYGFTPAFAEPNLQEIIKACADWRAKGYKVAICLWPINYQRMLKVCDAASIDKFEKIAAYVTSRLADKVDLFIDCLKFCEAGDFIDEFGHLYHRGKERLAEAMGREVSENFQLECFEGDLHQISNPVSAISWQEMKTAAEQLSRYEVVKSEELNKMKSELAEAKAKYDSERHRRLKIKSSLSWKMSAPIRAIGRALGLPNKVQ
jgi:hypothetical protein